jgi:hypothetical protein
MIKDTIKTIFFAPVQENKQLSEEEVLGTYAIALGSAMILVVFVLFLAYMH